MSTEINFVDHMEIIMREKLLKPLTVMMKTNHGVTVTEEEMLMAISDHSSISQKSRKQRRPKESKSDESGEMELVRVKGTGKVFIWKANNMVIIRRRFQSSDGKSTVISMPVGRFKEGKIIPIKSSPNELRYRKHGITCKYTEAIYKLSKNRHLVNR